MQYVYSKPPWKIVADETRPRLILATDGSEVARMIPRGVVEITEENARLIVGAYEMFAALEVADALHRYDNLPMDREGFTASQVIEVLKRHGWPDDDMIGSRQWALGLRDKALAIVRESQAT
jgi:hypothetical protein